jgi:glucan biosynthesis protein C
MKTETVQADGIRSRTSSTTATTSAKTRLTYVDSLRVALIMLVVAHHAAQAYGPTGGNWPVTNPSISRVLGPFFAVNSMFFMGLFFLLAGYFVPRSFDRKGGTGFLKSRFVRLGIPALFVAWFVFGPMVYFTQEPRLSLTEYVRYLYGTGWQVPYVHLWFLLHLLLYSFVYLLWRQITKGKYRINTAVPLPTYSIILVFIVTLALVSFVVRIWYPIDRWVPLLYLIPAEIAHLPQYVTLFILGILAYRGNWLNKFSARSGMIWLGIGLLAAAAYYVYSLWGAQLFAMPGIDITATGGLDWRSLVYCLWEALVCIGLCIGLLVLFRERFNRSPSRLLMAMIGAAYAVYIIHWLVVVGIQAGFTAVNLAPFIKFLLVTIIAIVISFGIGYLMRLVPGAKKII